MCTTKYYMLSATTSIRLRPDLRQQLERAGQGGLRQASWIMIDKVTSIRRERISRKIGALDASEISSLDVSLQRWLSLD